jgi:hypothetical protein
MAKLMNIAGKQGSNELFAILDKYGRTMYQIWSTRENISKNYKII